MASFDKLVEIWGNIRPSEMKSVKEDIGNYQKRLVDYFHVGPFYFFVFDIVNTSFEFVSDNMSEILGYDPLTITVHDYIEKIHPEDIPFFVQCENAVVEFSNTLEPLGILDYKISYDYRVRRVDGNYVRILQQVITLDADPESGMIYKTMGIHTDITHIKPVDMGNKHSTLSFMGMNGKSSYVKSHEDLFGFRQVPLLDLSHRQIQIVSCLMKGMSSKQIAEQFSISKHTVDTHRRKILSLLEVNNTQQMIIKLSQMGWL